ncbi:SLC13 family permease [Fuscovulum blasticum]|uniref:SLC13 family permease n=1 Tax=Fuscovulum blasticum TaxID=1075 RepID=UPI000D3E87E5|nr:SLC13 family permease [Fuscovulum blasticum]AWD23146.1 sodium:sulfate symporter [Fuscovulum blasticum]
MLANILRTTVLSAAALLALWLAVGPLPQPMGASAGVVLLTLVLWATGALPPFVTGLIFFAAVLIPGLARPDLIFAGFGSAAVWLIVSGFVIGAAIRRTGLGARLAAALAPLAAGSYARLVTVMTITAMALGFVMPSSVGRAVVLVPVGMALADRLGLVAGTKGRAGLAVALALACNMPSFAILPSNIPNMILAGAAETQYGVGFSYMSYLVLHYPLLGVAKSAVAVLLVIWLFPDRARETAGAPASSPDAVAGTGAEARVAVILGLTLLLWMTDAWHGVNPAWIGIASAVLLLLPGIGAVPAKEFNAAVDFGMIVFVAAALGLGALVNASGIGAAVGGAVLAVLPLEAGQSFVNFLSLSLLSAVTGLVTTIPGVPAVLTPMAQDMVQTTGLSLQAVLMTQVVGFSTVVFPYQVGPLILAMQLSGERLGHLVRVTLPLTAVTLVLLLPLDWLWWRLLGWL